jgi:hypothetical protein
LPGDRQSKQVKRPQMCASRIRYEWNKCNGGETKTGDDDDDDEPDERETGNEPQCNQLVTKCLDDQTVETVQLFGLAAIVYLARDLKNSRPPEHVRDRNTTCS